MPKETTPMPRPTQTRNPPSPRPDLGQHYREIGIGAVQAALCYRAESKNQAYAPVKPVRVETRTFEAEAA